MKINAGRFSERVEMQAPPAADDGSGGQTGGWRHVTTVWASVEAQRGGEAAQAAIATSLVQYRVTIRHRAIDSGHRLLWRRGHDGSDVLAMDIRAVMPSTDRASVVLLCEAKAA